MRSHSESQFLKLYNLFKSREKEIPRQSYGKMLFIASRVCGDSFNSSLYDSNSSEAAEIAALDRKSLTIIFNTLVQALLLQKKPQKRDCKIKFNSFFEFWKEARVLIEGNELVFVIDKLAYKYSLHKLSVVNCRKNNRCFEVFIGNRSLLSVKFLSGEVYDQFLSQLQSSIQACRQGRNQMPQQIQIPKKQQKKEEIENVSYQVALQEEIVMEKEIIPSKMNVFKEEEEKLHAFEEMERKMTMQDYNIAEEAESIYILESKNEPKIHINLILKTSTDLWKIVNFYLQQQEWNSTIASEHIIELDENIFEIFRVFKKDSIFQLERCTLTQATVFCSKNTASITEETKSLGKRDNKLVCLVSSTSKFYRCLGGVKISLDCSFDGKGFCSVQDSCSMLGKWYKDIRYFENNFNLAEIQKSKVKFLINKENRISLLGEREPYLRHYQKSGDGKMKMEMILDNKPEKESDNISTNDTLEMYVPKESQQNLKNAFFKLRPLKPAEIPSLEYIQLVTNFQFEKHYYEHRFDQSIMKSYDNHTPPYCLSEFLKRKDYEISKKKELVFINTEVIQGQKDSLIFVIKQIGANLISGKSVLNVSLPVDIFEPRTLLQRSAASFGMVPDYLIPVADADPLTQIKNITTLFSTIPTLQLTMLKPFNPILGETFQAYIKGIPIYFEQISHHPPISSYYMTCPEFTLYGNLVAFADVSLNSAVGGNEGITYIKMRNGSQFQCYFPPCQISGLIFGQRTFRAYGKGFILEKKKNLFAEISIQKAKKGLYDKGDQQLFPGSILGGIFKIRPDVMEGLARQPSLRKYSGLSMKDVESKLADIRGTWFEQVRIDNEVRNKNIKIYPLQYSKVALPSDGNYRLDVLYHKLQDIPQSQKEKQILQMRQRGDRKLREKYSKLMKKKK